MTRLRSTLILAMLTCLSWSASSVAQEALVSLPTDRGYRLQIYSQVTPLEINRIHSWELSLTDSDGVTVTDVTIQISGGMPEHDHGMPTLPRVTQTLANGRLLLQGVRFHMPGFWELIFDIQTPTGADRAKFEFTL